MERGLLWLPLLVLFIGLAWAGWNEYQKVEAYRLWAEDFDHAKYDIYGVLGQKDLDLTWGKPARGRPLILQSFSLTEVESIELLVNQQPVASQSLPEKGDAALRFTFIQDIDPVIVPFTEISLARDWWQHLQPLVVAKLD